MPWCDLIKWEQHVLLVCWDPQDHPQAQWFAGRAHRTQYLPHLTVYYNEMIQMKISKGKRHKARSPGETRHNLVGGHPQWSYREALNSPRRKYDWTRAGEWPAREAHLNLGAQGFYLGAIPMGMRPMPRGSEGKQENTRLSTPLQAQATWKSGWGSVSVVCAFMHMLDVNDKN